MTQDKDLLNIPLHQTVEIYITTKSHYPAIKGSNCKTHLRSKADTSHSLSQRTY